MPAFGFFHGTSTDHFSYFARTLNDHFLPSSVPVPFLSYRPDGAPRWIIILALLDKIFGASSLVPGPPYQKPRERGDLSADLSVSLYSFISGASDTKSEGILVPECTDTIVLFPGMTDIHIRVYKPRQISFAHPSRKGDDWSGRWPTLTAERSLTSHLEPKNRAYRRASPAEHDKS